MRHGSVVYPLPLFDQHLTLARVQTNVSYPNVQAAYETGWGSVVNKAAAGSPYIDYGNGCDLNVSTARIYRSFLPSSYMNDHLFHYGYLLQAGAVIAK